MRGGRPGGVHDQSDTLNVSVGYLIMLSCILVSTHYYVGRKQFSSVR